MSLKKWSNSKSNQMIKRGICKQMNGYPNVIHISLMTIEQCIPLQKSWKVHWNYQNLATFLGSLSDQYTLK